MFTSGECMTSIKSITERINEYISVVSNRFESTFREIGYWYCLSKTNIPSTLRIWRQFYWEKFILLSVNNYRKHTEELKFPGNVLLSQNYGLLSEMLTQKMQLRFQVLCTSSTSASYHNGFLAIKHLLLEYMLLKNR